MPSRISEGGSNTKATENSQHARFSADTFVDPTLDPVEFLNSTLPRLSIGAGASATGALGDVSSSTQTLLSQLGAHSSQLSTRLTQLTDEILRSGSRLAYEVEILRGDTIGLHDALTDTLQHEVDLFGGLNGQAEAVAAKDIGVEADATEDDTFNGTNGHSQPEPQDPMTQEPEFIQKLRMFNQVKTRLEDVIAAFGEAMEWPLAPSELSVASSFISVSAPESDADTQSQEEKGREIANKLRSEVHSLLSGSNKDTASVMAAARRTEHLRNLAQVWKGTAEEKVRVKFVENLSKLVEEQKRALGMTGETDATVDGLRPSEQSGTNRAPSPGNISGARGGLFRGLQRLREEIYLE